MKFSNRHTLTFGVTTQQYHSDNVFWSCCPQSNYTYNSLADFYTDANDYLANPNRTTSPVDALRASRCATRTSRTWTSRFSHWRSGTAAATCRTSGGHAGT